MDLARCNRYQNPAEIVCGVIYLRKLPGVNLGGFETFTGLMFVVMAAKILGSLDFFSGAVKK